jgi:hypothetical protein
LGHWHSRQCMNSQICWYDFPDFFYLFHFVIMYSRTAKRVIDVPDIRTGRKYCPYPIY